MPKGIVTPDWLMAGNDVPSFQPPVLFSRFDSTATNLFRKSHVHRTREGAVTEAEEDIADGIIGNTRIGRRRHASYISFRLTGDLPTAPISSSGVMDQLKLKFITTEQFTAVKEFFDRRPIVSKMVISYETKVPNDKLRYILPMLSFYFTTGPWRIMWVRFGYDPRKDFDSRYYQQLDYRVRMHLGIRDHVSCGVEPSNFSFNGNLFQD